MAERRKRTLSRLRNRKLAQPRSVQREDVPAIKGMLIRGDPQSDIAAFFGVNSGRVCEINTKRKYASIDAMAAELLPPPGPYMSLRSALRARDTLIALRDLITQTLQQIEGWGDRGER